MSENPDGRRLITWPQDANSEVWEVLVDGTRRIRKIITLPINIEELDETEVNRGSEYLSKMVSEHTPLCKLRHPNLVQLFNITANHNEFRFIVDMEWIERKSLEKRITDAARGLPEKDIKLYSTQICRALKHLHENNVLHRNINGKTVMITHDNVVKLIDFGISITLLDEASRKLTACARGEPQFMAPELCMLDESQGGFMYSRESDIWAFGCVVFYMATGRKPLGDCQNMMAIVRRICDDEPPGLPDTCSEALRSFHKKCMPKERKQRASAENLLDHGFLSPPSQ